MKQVKNIQARIAEILRNSGRKECLEKAELLTNLENSSKSLNLRSLNLSTAEALKIAFVLKSIGGKEERPYELVDRTKSYFIYPDKEYEKIGEVNQVCFVEGLVKLNDKWLLYYGTADSKIAVAISPFEK